MPVFFISFGEEPQASFLCYAIACVISYSFPLGFHLFRYPFCFFHLTDQLLHSLMCLFIHVCQMGKEFTAKQHHIVRNGVVFP